VTDIFVINENANCDDGCQLAPENCPYDLFHYAWYGLRGGYYDKLEESMFDIPCYGYECKGEYRKQILSFPMI